LKTSYISARYHSDARTRNAPETSLHMYKIDSISSSKPSMVVSRGGDVDERGTPINQSLAPPPQNLVSHHIILGIDNVHQNSANPTS